MSKITYQRETFLEIWPDARALLEDHYKEIGLYNDKMVFDPDLEAYTALCKAGMLYILSAREGNKLVGYCVFFLQNSLHYKATSSAHNDVFYIRPEYRKGFIGVRLLKKAEKFLKEKGVEVLWCSFKTYAPLDSLFKRLGWDFSEKVYTKYIGE